jgi:DNA-binding transcriptional LysR family regulator
MNMQISRSDLADFASFLAIARHRSISHAGLELGISASALSHALKGLEARLGIRLVNRTTRSVTLTAAGEQLYSALTEPMAAIGEAIDDLNRFREGPSGRVRLNVPQDAATYLLAPVLPSFVERYPDVELEIAVSNRLIDVIEGGFDAGIRFGGTVPKDMVAQRLSADIRWVVVGSPDYLDRFGTPKHPEDLQHHRCLRIRLGTGHLYRWDFERDGEALAVSVPGPFTIDESHFALTLVSLGGGLVYAPEPAVTHLVAAGSLRIVLQDWLPMGPGYHIYYSGRRHVPVGLKFLIEHIREMRPLGL